MDLQETANQTILEEAVDNDIGEEMSENNLSMEFLSSSIMTVIKDSGHYSL